MEIWIDSETWNRKRDQKLLALSLPKGAQAFEITSFRYRKLREGIKPERGYASLGIPQHHWQINALGTIHTAKKLKITKASKNENAQMWNKLEIQIDCSEWAMSSQNVYMALTPCWGSPHTYHLLTNLKGKTQVLAATRLLTLININLVSSCLVFFPPVKDIHTHPKWQWNKYPKLLRMSEGKHDL